MSTFRAEREAANGGRTWRVVEEWGDGFAVHAGGLDAWEAERRAAALVTDEESAGGRAVLGGLLAAAIREELVTRGEERGAR